MLQSLKKIFGVGPKADYKQLVKSGAKIIDVRTKREYAAGHIEGSVNIPLNELMEGVKKLNKNTVLITCCASGARSASAKVTLGSAGFTKVYNGGGWTSLENKI
jgi:phage shock protein E